MRRPRSIPYFVDPVTLPAELKAIAARTRSSHGGRYYTLNDVAQFDELGLWSYREMWFSVRGTLLETAANLVETAEYGYFVVELDNVLYVSTKDALRKLVRAARFARAGWAALPRCAT